MKQEIYGPGSPTHQFIRKMKRREKEMKEDDWSLKGKDFIVDCPAEKLDGTPIKAYYDNDIETIRKKLIEDIESYSDDDIVPHINQPTSHLIWVINKRFGVEE